MGKRRYSQAWGHPLESWCQREGILSMQAMDGQNGRQNPGDTRNQQCGPHLPKEAEKGSVPKI